MSINEVPAHQSNLTEKQQREALNATYGVSMSPNTNTQLTYEERVRMRRHLDDLDAKEAGGMKEFDLNKPPVPPYRYLEYPFLMYNHGTKQAKPAHNYEQRQKMLAEGWSEEPVPVQTPEVELTASERMQAEEIDRQLKMPKERLETERSAEYMAKMRAENEELKARLAHQEPQESDIETEATKKAKRSKA